MGHRIRQEPPRHTPTYRRSRTNHVEQASPIELRKSRGKNRADKIPSSDHRSKDTLILAPTLEGHDIANNHHTEGRDAASSNTGETAEEVEHWRIFRETAHQFCEDEEEDRGKVDLFTPEDVAETSVEDLEGRVADQTGCTGPAYGVFGIELARVSMARRKVGV